MQSVISSNQKSITETKMEESSNGFVPFYANEPTFPALGIQYQSINPYINITGAPANNSVTFKLPAGAGFLYEASVGFVCTYTIDATDNVNAPIGINMIRSIEWLSNGQPIVYKTGHAIWAQVLTWKEPQFQQFMLKYSKMLKPATEKIAAAADTSFLTYLPLMDSFLTQVEKALLLNKINDLQLRITFNSTAESGLITAGGITAVTNTLYVQTYMPKLSVYQEMVTQDWSKKLVMQSVNTYTEVAPLSAVTSTSYTLTCPFLAFKSHFAVKSVVAVASVGVQQYDINSFTMNLNGVTFTNAMPTSRMNSCASKYGTSNTSVAGADAVTFANDILTVDWGVLCGRSQNSGTAFLQELQGSNISITFDTVTTAANARLFVVHEVFNSLAYENNILYIESNN